MIETMMTTMAIPPFGHLYHTDQKYKLLRCSLWKQKEITYDELPLFMKPFAQHGESDLAGIERQSANLLDRDEQNKNFATRYLIEFRAMHANNKGSCCNINYFNIF